MNIFKCMAVTAFFLLTATLASALDTAPYSAESFATAQSAGKSVALHFHADWCPVCKVQANVLNALKMDKTLNTSVLVVNYDSEKALAKQLKVASQSTLIVFKGHNETARIAGVTDADKIKATLLSAN